MNSAGDLGVPRVKKAHVTVAHSPKITKNKIVEPVKPASPPRLIKANPFLPPKAFVPKIEHRIIKPSNFKLPGEDLSERKKMELEEKKLEEETKLEQQRQFRANPMFVAYAEVSDQTVSRLLIPIDSLNVTSSERHWLTQSLRFYKQRSAEMHIL